MIISNTRARISSHFSSLKRRKHQIRPQKAHIPEDLGWFCNKTGPNWDAYRVGKPVMLACRQVPSGCFWVPAGQGAASIPGLCG